VVPAKDTAMWRVPSTRYDPPGPNRGLRVSSDNRCGWYVPQKTASQHGFRDV